MSRWIKSSSYWESCLCAITLVLLPIIGSAQTPKPKGGKIAHLLSNARKIVEIARTPAATLTLSELKDLLPKGTTVGEPSWVEGDIATGNVAELKGSLTGIVVFQNEQQRVALRSHSALTDGQRAFRSDDPIANIQIYLGDSLTQLVKSFERQVLEVLTKGVELLPKETPDSVQLDSVQLANLDTSDVSGWVATWRFGDQSQRSIDLWRHWYGHKYAINIYLMRE